MKTSPAMRRGIGAPRTRSPEIRAGQSMTDLERFSRYLTILLGVSPKSASLYTRQVKAFLFWMEKDGRSIDPATMRREDVEDFFEHNFYRHATPNAMAEGNSNATRNAKQTALGHYFKYLLRERVVAEDITALIPRPKVDYSAVEKFTHGEVQRFFAAADITREKGLRDACVFILAAFRGLRAGEIVGLTLQSLIEESAGSLDIHIVGKFSKHRQIYLWKAPSRLLFLWRSVRISHGARSAHPLFVTYRRGNHHQRNRLTIHDLDKMVKTYARVIGVEKPKISMHMFRATHASDLRHIEGYDTPAIAERLGHRSIATTDRYIPTRGRIHKTYASLAAYWRDVTGLWGGAE